MPFSHHVFLSKLLRPYNYVFSRAICLPHHQVLQLPRVIHLPITSFTTLTKNIRVFTHHTPTPSLNPSPFSFCSSPHFSSILPLSRLIFLLNPYFDFTFQHEFTWFKQSSWILLFVSSIMIFLCGFFSAIS